MREAKTLALARLLKAKIARRLPDMDPAELDGKTILRQLAKLVELEMSLLSSRVPARTAPADLACKALHE